MSLPLPKMTSKAVQKITSNNVQNMSVTELQSFMQKHGFNEKTLADFLGVTVQAIRLWTRGQREISIINTRILRMMNKYPHLMKEF